VPGSTTSADGRLQGDLKPACRASLGLRWRRGEARWTRLDAVAGAARLAEDTTQLAECVELMGDLADAVLALEEPYRSPLLGRSWAASAANPRGAREICRPRNSPRCRIRHA